MIKVLVLVIGLAAQAGALSQSPPAATISGIVIDADSRAPIPFAVVRIGDARPYAQFREVVAGEDGRFQFEKIVAGDYFLGASLQSFAPGYFGSNTPGAPDRALAVAAGLSQSDLEIRLSRGAVIAGRVTEPNGEPVPNAMISLSRNGGPVFGGSFTAGAGGPMHTNSSGEFRCFGLPPGEYVVAADGSGRKFALGSTDGPVVQLAATYYPSALTRNDAQKITLRTGEERTGVDIIQRLVRLHSLSGTVTMPSTVAAGDVSVVLRSRSGEYRQERADLKENGDFLVEALEPGDFWVGAESRDAAWFGATSVTIRDRMLTGVSITLEPTVSLTGRIVLDPAIPAGVDAQRLTVSFTPVGDSPRAEPRFSATDSTGRFGVKGLLPRPHSVFVSVRYPNGPELVVVGIEILGQASRSNLVDLDSSGLTGVVVHVAPKRRQPSR